MFLKWINQKRQTFGVRLNLWFATVLIILSAALFLTAYYLLSRSVELKDREVVYAQAEVYRSWYLQGGLAGLSDHFAARTDSGKESFFVRVTGPGREGLFMSVPKPSDQFDPSTLDRLEGSGPLTWITLPAANQSTSWLIATLTLSDGDRLQVGKTTEAQAALLEHFQFVFGWVVLGAVVLGLAGGSLLTRRALAPIQQLIAGLRQVIATGQFDQRLPVTPANDELSQLARLFNELLEKNTGLIRGMREALDNVAHDLRTPLARLRATAENALQESSDGLALREALSDSLEESDRVVTMLDTLMDISEAEVGLMKLEPVTVNIASLFSGVTDLYQLVAEDKQITVTTDVPAELTCFADPNRLRQVLVNLLDNALKYTPAGGHVRFSAHGSAAEVILEMTDDGMGISPEETPRIWDRLYRSDKSRTQRGLGLGLSLVKAVVGAHHGQVTVKSEPTGGSTFVVKLPSVA